MGELPSAHPFPAMVSGGNVRATGSEYVCERAGGGGFTQSSRT